MTSELSAKDAKHVQYVVFESTRVAVLEHRGDPRWLGQSVQTFIDWRKQNRLPPKLSATFNIPYENRSGLLKDYRFDLCAAIEGNVADNSFGIVEKTIPGGRCAVLRHIGSDDTLGETVHYLNAVWFPSSGETRRDFPIYFQRVQFVPDVEEDEAITDVFLPIQ